MSPHFGAFIEKAERIVIAVHDEGCVGSVAANLAAASLAVGLGSNIKGQLGDGMTYQNRPTPAAVSGLTGVIDVSAGDFYSPARTGDGRAWAWGDNNIGKLGDGTTADRHTPVPVATLTRVRAIRAGSAHSLALVAP